MTGPDRWLDLGWLLVTNVIVVAGVVAWGWPPGNVFVLFWIENVVLGAVTAVRIATAQAMAPDASAPSLPSGSPTPDAGRLASAAFFVVHYGIFAVVHGAFVMIVATAVGLSWGWWTLAMPALLITLRYVFDLVTGWFLGGQRRRVSVAEAFAHPYPRLVVLHVATLLGFAFSMSFARRGTVGGFLAGLGDWLAARGLSLDTGALLVVLLMVLKTCADVVLLTRRVRLRVTPSPDH